MIYRAGCLSCRAETALRAALVKNGNIFTENQLYWIDYLYRYWHYYIGESSREIYGQAPVCTMKRNYTMFHTMDPALAVEKLKEIYNQKIADKQDVSVK